MKKIMNYQHLDKDTPLRVEFDIYEEDGHWVAKMRILGQGDVKAPTFYGASAEQAERQLRKVFMKDYELVSEEAADE